MKQNKPRPFYDKKSNVDPETLTLEKVVRDLSEPVIIKRDKDLNKKYTSGPLEVEYDTDTGPNDEYFLGFYRVGPAKISGYNAEADAQLIAEAFNVTHETGLTPRQLVEQRNELLEALKGTLAMLELLNATGRNDPIEARVYQARAAIARAEMK